MDLYCGEGSTCPANELYVSENRSMKSQVDLYLRWSSVNLRHPYECTIDMSPHHVVGERASRVVSIMTGDPYRKYPHDAIRNKVYVSRAFSEFNGDNGNHVLYNLIVDNPSKIAIGNGKGNYALYVGTIRPEKGIHTAAEICAEAGFDLIVYGEPHPSYQGYNEELKRRFSNVDLRGVLPAFGPEHWTAFQDASVFLYPIRWCDAFPLATLESMLCGTPVVGCPNGGIVEQVINGISGFLYSEIKAEHILAAKKLDRSGIRENVKPIIDPDAYMNRLLGFVRQAREGETW